MGCREPPPSSTATAAPAARPGALAHSPTFSQPHGRSGLPSTPTPTHTRSHTPTPRRSSLLHSPAVGARASARARPRSHTARATPAEAAPRCPRPRRRVQSPGARPGPALQARLRGVRRGRWPAGPRARLASLTPPSGSNTWGGPPGVWDPPSRHPVPTRGHRRPLGLRRGDGARSLGGKRERESASRTRFPPPTPNRLHGERETGGGARFVPYSKPRD